MKIAIIFGSKSDMKVMKKASDVLKDFQIEHKGYILSAHRVPEKLFQTIEELEKEKVECIIAGAGLAAHLPGVIASKTNIPVIGVPIDAAIGGIDALLSIVQMPKGIPVATVGINNASNAAFLAVQILALKYPSVMEKLINYKKEMKEKYISENGEGVDF